MPELRKYLRYHVLGSAVLKPEDGTSRNIKTDLADLSFLGMGVYAQDKIEAGSNVRFELLLRSWIDPVIGTGKVQYAVEVKQPTSRMFRMGIEFLDIDKRIIQDALSHIQAQIHAEARKKEQLKKHHSESGYL